MSSDPEIIIRITPDTINLSIGMGEVLNIYIEAPPNRTGTFAFTLNAIETETSQVLSTLLGSIIISSCNLNEVRCGRNNTVEKCLDGEWTVIEICEFGCSGGMCIEEACIPGETRCLDMENMLVCTDEGEWSEPVYCVLGCDQGRCILDLDLSTTSIIIVIVVGSLGGAYLFISTRGGPKEHHARVAKYVLKTKKLGYSEKQIKGELKKSGWKQKHIKEGFKKAEKVEDLFKIADELKKAKKKK